MKTVLLVGVSALIVLAGSEARADDRRACLEAAAQGQTLRDAHRIVEAREQFRICAQESCPAVVQKDCSGWLEAAERSLPTVVVEAKDEHGTDLFDVAVSVDGQPLVAKLDGNAVPVNPGRHTFHFQWAGPPQDQSVLVREGEKDQRVVVALRPLVTTAAAGTGTTGAVAEEHSSGSGLRTAGWLIGALGVVGLGVGTAFGVVAIGDKNDANCNSLKQCQPDALSRAKSAALVADVGLIGGGVLVALGGAFVIFAPSGAHAPTSTGAVRLVPTIGATGGGMSLAGSW